MLSTLRTIVQEVSSAKGLQAALRTIVQRAKAAMHTEVCSIFLYNQETSRYTLMASEGLNPDAVGRVSLSYSEGLVGQVGLKEEPINLDDAPSHPKYCYVKETGEERYRAFLGVPIIHQRKILGVMVVQQSASRHFNEHEEAFLVTMSAQLAGVIAHAEATGSLEPSLYFPRKINRFQGTSGASGVAIGHAVVLAPLTEANTPPDKNCDNIDKELAYLERAIAGVKADLHEMASKLADRLPSEELALFDVYLRILDDNALGHEIRKRVSKGVWAQNALRQVIGNYVSQFEDMEDPYLRERAVDVKDLGRRVLSYLQESKQADIYYPEATILISEELAPAMLGEVPHDRLAGLISLRGSGNSHVAILAKTLGIPTVMGAVDLPFRQLSGKQLIVDGNLGLVYSSPSKELINYYQEAIEEEREFAEGLETVCDLSCTTLDGHAVKLWVNTGLMADAPRSIERGASGVGLYRTEISFIIRERFPTESEQVKIYRQQLKTFAPLPVTMRTLDIGGDKSLSYFPIQEDNPFLGWRGIRVTLDHPEIFLVQVRAMLKASAGLDNLRIMLPMITSVYEVEEALHLIQRAHSEVLAEGITVMMPLVGIMIEVPAAVYQIAELASRVDFLSVGSNDLTQYILAVDRNNPRVSDLYSELNPAVLKALKLIAQEAHKADKPVSICGEMAGDPATAILLIAMGFDALSMNATNLLKVKWAIRKISLKKAQRILSDIMQLDNTQMIKRTLELMLYKEDMGKMLYSKRRRLYTEPC
ncbi:MAG: phosphoenolpyruvate--protein phosphotransferase [Endozoicomonas sp. (ex Botrylloides leachii)]|nr:phosphoenolpyruvate--protein phosphotransferase [Endozoicomonas sp. (ex Botrylloides leachii)]